MTNRAEEFLGAKVKDRLTNLEGYCIAYTQHLYGCNHVIVEPGLNKEGVPGKIFSFDEQRIEITAPPSELFARAPLTDRPGGPALEIEPRD